MLDKDEIKQQIQLLKSNDTKDVDLAFELLYHNMDKNQLPTLQIKRNYKKLLEKIRKVVNIGKDRRFVNIEDANNHNKKQLVYDNIAWKMDNFNTAYKEEHYNPETKKWKK